MRDPGTRRDDAEPVVSIVVPVYNGVATIGNCIESFLALEWPRDRLEIIVVDNGSADGTPARLAHFGAAIRVLHESTRGAAAARNRGIREARGSIVAFTDADCTADPGWLTALLPPFADGHVGVVGGQVLSRRPCNRIELFGEQIHDQRAAIQQKEEPYVITGNWASPRTVLLEVGLFDESLRRGQDVDLSWRIRRAGYRLVYAPGARVFHRNERTLWGLVHEGFVHGLHNTRIKDKHAAFGAIARRTNIRHRLGADVRRLVRRDDTVNAALRLVFDVGKSAGELCALAIARPPAAGAARSLAGDASRGEQP